MHKSILVTLATLMVAASSSAQQICLEDQGTGLELPSSLTEPQQFTQDCICLRWDASTGRINHYHAYSNGINFSNPMQRVTLFCFPALNQVYEITVEGVSEVLGEPFSAIPPSLFVERVARDTTTVCVDFDPAQCVTPDGRVVPCP